MSTFLERTYKIWVPAIFLLSVGLMFLSAVMLAQRDYLHGAVWGVVAFALFIPMLWWLLGAAQRELEERKMKVSDLLVAYGVQPDRADELLTKLQTEMRGITVR